MKIGIDLGGSHIAIGVVNDEGKLIAKEEENILFINKEQNEIKKLITNKILCLINTLKQKLQIPAFIIDEIGIGVPGIIENNIIKKCDKYGIYQWDLAEDLQQVGEVRQCEGEFVTKSFVTNSLSPCHIKLTNDAIAGTKAEITYGSLKDADCSVYLCIGTGIGGTIVSPTKSTATTNSNLENGICISKSHEIHPSELGHMVIEKNGRQCHCGRMGCFETYCSMRTFKNDIIELLDLCKDTTSEELHSILRRETTKERLNTYIDNYVKNLVLGIGNIINIVHPQKICIGGSFVFFEDVFYDKLISQIQNCKLQFEVPEIVLAAFQNDAGIIGAVL